MEFKIEERIISEKKSPLIIPEVGINHEGSIQKAFRLIDSAKNSGAEIIKFQCHITDKEMIKTADKPGKISNETLWDIVKRCELTMEEEYKIKKYAEKNKLIYLSTPFSKEAVDRLMRLKVSAFKIGSGECNNYPLIEYIAKIKLPVILSTGMNNINSIKKSVSIFKKFKTPYSLLHCTSMYPTPYEKVRLGGITELKKNFRKIEVGLSDHSKNIWTCLGAVAVGASILEKHFTISRKWKGPDMPVSIEPSELRDLIVGSDAIWKAAGGKKGILKEEIPVIKFAYASVVSTRDIKKGEKLTKENIWVKRPGKGEFMSKDFKKLLGKKAIRNIFNNRYISSKDLKI
ncbi:N-acetylneuraminate synthase family protein [Candidatus Pelagibacter sp. Uisw_106]|uniref:N-acetylneuraminate synthase family protein n=1 Tax=Candidatus Pelagibacter sp. Uisw_106 TaxID=3230984 RepID=UPI0039E75EE5